jgi:hypothetical protein
MPDSRSRRPITVEHLKLLAGIAERERRTFFGRNRRAKIYQNRFIAAALCQGAALHYLGLGTGVKDFDIHLFHVQHPARRQIARRVRRVRSNVPGFGERMVDIIWTVIPERIASRGRANPSRTIREFLKARPTENARFLAQKPVVGLLPERILGRLLWPRLPILKD